jgi:ribonuclease HI
MTNIIEIYTDGGCWPNPGNGGWACILKFGGVTKELSGNKPDSTNNQMELEAIHQALLALKENAHKYTIKIFSDSQWAINACNGSWNIKKNLDKVQAIRKLISDSKFTIEWEWVKGHNGHPENERCDELAQAEVKKLSTQI